ncbi:alkaline phosphatase family protein [Aquibium sp. ELW1220]|uniref:alkaline phosphatase family protein n=1 Tax=Aquibium sp. ELW1220 TaxID=2976766 RepID=UPI0025B075C6|nr:alkaline phosphatase family protein [Aquibium sp. ELW1220]MDN2584045.1 alkaline phosphatase family protein [Aquibium sp. ELW1220]
MPARVLLVAIDGASATLVDRLMAAGCLPHLAGLRAAGAGRPLSAPAGVTDDGLWASFHYGAGLGAHGRYHYLFRLPDGGTALAPTGEDQLQAWWEREPGLRVALFDLPKSRAPRPLNGLHLADWLVHGRYFTEPASFPPGLAAETVARFGAAPPSRCSHAHGVADEADIADILVNLRLSVSRKRAAGLHHLASEAWDVFAIGFKEAHCAGHAFWDGAAERPAHGLPAGDPQRIVLTEIDAAVGALVAAAGPDADVAVFTITEMQANSTLDHLAPALVGRLNAACGEPVWRRLADRWLRSRPHRLIEALPYNENALALRVHHSDAAARNAVLDRAEALLVDLADAATGLPAVLAVERPSRDCPGPRAALLPDLLLPLPPGLAPRAIASSVLGRIEAGPPPLRPGNHRAGGSILAAGRHLDLAAIAGMEDIGSAVAAAARAARNAEMR